MDKGLKILIDYLWESGHWKDRSDRTISQEDLELAKKEGYMFDLGKKDLAHEDTMKDIEEVLKQINPIDVANAFLYSLSTRKLEYRCALGSYWYAAAIPKHEQDSRGILGTATCMLCDWNNYIDFNVENFCRYTYGGGNYFSTHSQIALFDLQQFLKLPKVEPTAEDKEILKRILNCVDMLDENDKVGKLRDRIVKEKIYKTNKGETSRLLDILGLCGVLSSKEYPCFYDRFVDAYERGAIEAKSDFAYPVNRWRKKDGIDKKWFKRVFGYEY